MDNISFSSIRIAPVLLATWLAKKIGEWLTSEKWNHLPNMRLPDPGGPMIVACIFLVLSILSHSMR